MNTIVTFYSYKGGVGRSMSLVNTGVTLAAWGYRVLLVDFDLEAPGLEFFFRPLIGNFDGIQSRPGVIDILSAGSNERPPDWRQFLIQVPLPPLGSSDKPASTIDILKSGAKGSDTYLEQLAAFRADDFYKERNGGRIVEALRDEWKAEYDFVLVDSRTGLTDIGGMCTIQLPDVLVMLFTATDQGWAGVTDVAGRALKHHSALPFERERLKVLPVLTRVDSSEKELMDQWLSRFSRTLPAIVSNWIDAELVDTDQKLRAFVDRTFIPYVPYYSFGEGIAVLDNVSSPSGMGYASVGLAALIAGELRDSGQFVERRDDYVARVAQVGSERRQLREGAVELRANFHEVSVIFLGQGGAGKTTLVRRLFQPKRTLPAETETATAGIEIHGCELISKDGRRVRLNAWDFGGQEIYFATFQFFMTRRSIYVLVVDTRRNDSTEEFQYWLDLVQVLAPDSPVLIFQNEMGGRSAAIDVRSIRERYSSVREVFRGNLEHRDAADDLRDAIASCASKLSEANVVVPCLWIAVRSEIEQIGRRVPYIGVEQYFEIYRKHGGDDSDRASALALSAYLHDFGVLLHFQDDELLNQTLVLRPEWVTEAVYRLLSDERVRSDCGRFNKGDCERIWNQPVYAKAHSILLALLQRFEVCYAVPSSESPSWLVPQLLPPLRPEALKPRSSSGDLMLRYVYQTIPKNIVSRLIVRLQRFVIHPELAWKSGVQLAQRDTTILVEMLPLEREIELRGQGPERKSLLSMVASVIDSLNDVWRTGDKGSKLIPCICSRCSAIAEPEFFSEDVLRKRLEHNRLRIECPASFEEVNVTELISSVHVEFPQ